VGAAMARGSQLLKGNCALLVKAPKINIRGKRKEYIKEENTRDEKNQKRQKSPKRFVKTVTSAPLEEDQFI
jgi:hypothetical protein